MASPASIFAKFASEAKPRKFRNKPVQIDGFTFASAKEGQRYQMLKHMRDAGEIRDLVLQPRFALICNGVRVAHYVADFSYARFDGARVIEDVKSPITRKDRTYRLKAKMMAAQGNPVTEV